MPVAAPEMNVKLDAFADSNVGALGQWRNGMKVGGIAVAQFRIIKLPSRRRRLRVPLSLLAPRLRPHRDWED